MSQVRILVALLTFKKESSKLLKINLPIPNEIGLACSGGIDSMVILDFLLNNSSNKFKNQNRKIHLFHFNHQTEHSQDAESFVKRISEKHNLSLTTSTLQNERKSGQSLEEYWRNERYNFFHSFDLPIITAHHLSDCVETWLMTCLRGSGKLIGFRNQNVIRPFLTTSKQDILNWAERKNVLFIQDPSNFENVHDRNIVRNEMMPIVMKLNPGIEKTVRKLLLNKLKQEN